MNCVDVDKELTGRWHVCQWNKSPRFEKGKGNGWKRYPKMTRMPTRWMRSQTSKKKGWEHTKTSKNTTVISSPGVFARIYILTKRLAKTALQKLGCQTNFLFKHRQLHSPLPGLCLLLATLALIADGFLPRSYHVYLPSPMGIPRTRDVSDSQQGTTSDWWVPDYIAECTCPPFLKGQVDWLNTGIAMATLASLSPWTSQVRKDGDDMVGDYPESCFALQVSFDSPLQW